MAVTLGSEVEVNLKNLPPSFLQPDLR